MDTLPVEISLDGAQIKACDGEWLVDAITREKGLPHIRLSPAPWTDPDLRYLHG